MMEVQINTVYVGSFPSFHNTDSCLATLNNTSIAFTVQKVNEEDQFVRLIILKKDIVKAEACFQSANSFISFKLKFAAAQKIARRMGFSDQKEEQGFLYDTKQREASFDVGWIVIFINLTVEFGNYYLKFLPVINFIYVNEVPDFYETKKFLLKEWPLHKVGQLATRHQPPREDGRAVGRIDNFIFSMEEILKFRTIAAYISAISHKDFSPSSKIEIDFCLFPQWFLAPLVQKYWASHRCRNCGRSAQLKCTLCREARYCGEACQAAVRQEHREGCETSLEARQKGEKEEDFHVAELLQAWGRTSLARGCCSHSPGS